MANTKTIVLLALLLSPFLAWSQTNLHVANAGVLSSSAGTEIYVTGDVSVANGGQARLQDDLHIDANLTNEGGFHSTAALRYNGTNTLTYTANDRDTIGDIVLDATQLNISDTLEVLGSPITNVGNTRIITNAAADDMLLIQNTFLNGADVLVEGPLGLYGPSASTVTLNFPLATSAERKGVSLPNINMNNNYMIAEAVAAAAPNNPGSGVGGVLPDHLWYIRPLQTGSIFSNQGVEVEVPSGVLAADIPSTSILQSVTGFAGPYENASQSSFQNATLPYTIYTNGANLIGSMPDGYFALGQCIASAGSSDLVNLSPTVCENDTVRIEASGFDATANLQWIYSTDNGDTWSDFVGQTDPVFYTMGDVPVNANTLIALATSSAGSCLPDTSAPVALEVNQSLKLSVQAFLQGPYNSATDNMSTVLSTTPTASYPSLLDSTYSADSPVTTYQGETIPKMYRNAQIPNGAVDMVTIQMWDVALENKVGETHAWLMTDGTTRDFYAGQEGDAHFHFCGLTPQNAYIVVRNRNHLPILSENPYSIGYTTQNVDMTVPGSIAANNARVVDTSPVRLGLFGGNIYDNPVFNDQDEINSADFFILRVANNQLTGDFEYHIEDISCDGIVNAADLTPTENNARNLILSNAPIE